jgi:hypothetical protein
MHPQLRFVAHETEKEKILFRVSRTKAAEMNFAKFFLRRQIIYRDFVYIIINIIRYFI